MIILKTKLSHILDSTEKFFYQTLRTPLVLFCTANFFFLLMESIVMLGSTIKENPHLLNETEIPPYIFIYAGLFTMLTLVFQYANITDNKLLKNDLLCFAKLWFSILIFSCTMIMSEKVAEIYYTAQRYDIARTIFFLVHTFSHSIMIFYISILTISSIIPLTKVLIRSIPFITIEDTIFLSIKKYQTYFYTLAAIYTTGIVYIYLQIENKPTIWFFGLNNFKIW